MRFDAERLMEQWRAGNDAGLGYAVGSDDDGPYEAVERAGWGVLAELGTAGTGKGDVVLALTSDGSYTVVADANGPWAVTVDEPAELARLREAIDRYWPAPAPEGAICGACGEAPAAIVSDGLALCRECTVPDGNSPDGYAEALRGYQLDASRRVVLVAAARGEELGVLA